jgi:hypothetical protein
MDRGGQALACMQFENVILTCIHVADLLSFIIGIFTIYPAVRYFCIYTTVSIVFIYIYQITMFGAMMAWDGRREMANRHCLIPIKIETSAQAGRLFDPASFSS